MSAFKVAWMLLKNNVKIYKFYLVVLTITVAIYYNFLSISMNPYINVVENKSQSAQSAGAMASVVLFFVLIFFMVHANNFFYKQRNKEFGLYMLMGIKNRKIGTVFAIENTIIGVIALGAGGIIGVIFSKLFFMVFAKVTLLNVKIPFFFSMTAVITLMAIFGFILFILSIKNIYCIGKENLIDILNAEKHEQEPPKFKHLRGIIGVLEIATGYILAFKCKDWDLGYGFTTLVIFILVCWGTYLFFSGFMPMILLKCIENKKIVYKKFRLVSFNNMLFRLGTNYRSYAMTAILSAATLTALITGFTFKYFADSNTKMQLPYSIGYVNSDKNINKKVVNKIKESSHSLELFDKINFIEIDVETKKDNTGSKQHVLAVNYNDVIKSLKNRNDNKDIQELSSLKINSNEVVNIGHPVMITNRTNINNITYTINGIIYKEKYYLKIPLFGSMPNIGSYDILVLSENEYKKLIQNKYCEKCFNGINITNQEDSIELVDKLFRIVPDYRHNLNTYTVAYKEKYYLVGAYYFMALVLSLVFIIAAFSTLYFKCLSEALSDKKEYAVLSKIGMNASQMKRSINIQLIIAFLVPAILGSIHSLFAMKMIGDVLEINLWTCILKGSVLFAFTMFFFFVAIKMRYSATVIKEEY